MSPAILSESSNNSENRLSDTKIFEKTRACKKNGSVVNRAFKVWNKMRAEKNNQNIISCRFHHRVAENTIGRRNMDFICRWIIKQEGK